MIQVVRKRFFNMKSYFLPIIESFLPISVIGPSVPLFMHFFNLQEGFQDI